MREKCKIPDEAIVVHTYDELRQLVGAFANGHHELMTVVGNGGIGKSQNVLRILQKALGASGWTLLKGKHTPLDLYMQLYSSRTKPIVLDDLDGLFRDANNTALLKCVCDTTLVKRVEWGSNHRAFRGDANHLPKGFDSISRVCILANDVHSLNANIAAVQDRGVFILFRPDAVEVHREVARSGWFDDEEVFRFIGQHLFLVSRPSLRLYVTARNHRRSGLDWKELVLRTLGKAIDPKILHVSRLLSNPKFDKLPAPEAAREQAFKEQGGGSRATYHRYKKELLQCRGALDRDEVASIQLGPVKPDLMSAAMRDRRRQLEQLGDDDSTEYESEVSKETEKKSTAGTESERMLENDQLFQLRREMNQAVRREDYERAAILRDEIEKLKEAGD